MVATRVSVVQKRSNAEKRDALPFAGLFFLASRQGQVASVYNAAAATPALHDRARLLALAGRRKYPVETERAAG